MLKALQVIDLSFMEKKKYFSFMRSPIKFKSKAYLKKEGLMMPFI